MSKYSEEPEFVCTLHSRHYCPHREHVIYGGTCGLEGTRGYVTVSCLHRREAKMLPLPEKAVEKSEQAPATEHVL